MIEHCEIKAENARNVILSYGENVYFVSQVNVKIIEGEDKFKAIFHARKLPSNEPADLDIDINQRIYDMLVEYIRMDKFDMILVLEIRRSEARWCLVSEEWLQSQKLAPGKKEYIV